MLASRNEKYNSTIDILRILSIISVILIHSTTKVLDFTNNDLVNYPLTLFFNQISRFAVPLFFLISAFVLELNYPQPFSYLVYLKKRFSRLFLPYLFWSAIYYFIIYTSHSKSFFDALLLGDSSYQLYFVPTLFIFYLVFPLFHFLTKILSKKIVIISLFFLQIALLSLDYYLHPLPFPYPISVFLLNFDIFIMGILASRYQNRIIKFINKYQIFFIFLSLTLAFFIFLEGKSLYLNTHNYLSFYSQWRPSVFFYTLVLTSLLFSIFNKLKANQNITKIFASYSFFVYFIHIIFLEITWKFYHPSTFFYPLFLFVLVSALSYSSAYIISKLPFLKKITG